MPQISPGGAFPTGSSRINFSFQLGQSPGWDRGKTGRSHQDKQLTGAPEWGQQGDAGGGERMRQNITKELQTTRGQRCPSKTGSGIPGK